MTTKDGKLVTWGFLALIAWELWHRAGPAGPVAETSPIDPQSPITNWIQQLGSTYYNTSNSGGGGSTYWCSPSSLPPTRYSPQMWQPNFNPQNAADAAVLEAWLESGQRGI